VRLSFEHLEDFLDEQEREAFLKAVEACGGDEYEVAQVFEQGGYLQRALSRIGKTPTPGYEYKPIIYTKADGTKFVRIVEVEKNASTKTPDEDGFTKTNIIDDKNSSHTEERIYWGPWRRTTQIAEKPKADTENTNSNDGNATMPIQKDEANNKDILGKNQRDSTTERKNTPTKDTSSPSWKENKKDHQDENNGQGNQMRGADVKRRGSDQWSKKDNRDRIDHSIEKQRETSGKNRTDKTENLKNNSKTENTDSNREKRVEWGKTTAIETFKFMGDLPVSLLNEQASSIIKEYKSVQKEVPAYVLKQGRLTKVGVLSPLGLIYDTYQDAQKYNGGKFVGAVAINTGAFVGTILLDSALTSTGVGAIGVIATNVFVAEGTTWLKEKVLDEPKVEEKQ